MDFDSQSSGLRVFRAYFENQNKAKIKYNCLDSDQNSAKKKKKEGKEEEQDREKQILVLKP